MGRWLTKEGDALLITIIFILMLILNFFIDTEIPLSIFIVAAILSIDEIAVFLIGHVDTKEDRQRRKIYKNYIRK